MVIDATLAMPCTDVIHVCVVVSLQARQVHEQWVQLPAGSRVQDALERSAALVQWREQFGVDAPMPVGVWSRRVRLDTLLHDQDRVELYRPLRVDPKVARRERFQKQGARATGLFAKKRVGAKAGY